jgi:hypothetical protein
MSYADRFSQTHRTTFQDQARLAAQNFGSKLRATVMEQACTGEQSAPVLYYDKVEATEREGRGATIADNPAKRRRRWLKFRPSLTSGELIDSNDKFQGMMDFQSPLMQAHTAAIRRGIDRRRIIEGLFGDAYEGDLGGTVIPFAAGTQTIAANVQEGVGVATVGLNLAKLRASRKKFAAAEHDLDMQDIFCLVTAEQIDDLGEELKLTTQEYRADAGPQFSRDGKLMKVWNHTFIEYQGLPTKVVGADTIQRVPAYLKSGVMLGVWQEVAFKTNTQPQMYDELYMWCEANMDCRRLDETAVVEIECKIG